MRPTGTRTRRVAGQGSPGLVPCGTGGADRSDDDERTDGFRTRLEDERRGRRVSKETRVPGNAGRQETAS